MSDPKPETLNEAIKRLCPHCAAGHKPMFRASTKEWIHNNYTAKGPGTTGFSTTPCGANLVRKHGLGAA